MLSTPTEAPGAGPAREKACRGPTLRQMPTGAPGLAAAPSHTCEWRAGRGRCPRKNILLHDVDLEVPYTYLHSPYICVEARPRPRCAQRLYQRARLGGVEFFPSCDTYGFILHSREVPYGTVTPPICRRHGDAGTFPQICTSRIARIAYMRGNSASSPIGSTQSYAYVHPPSGLTAPAGVCPL